MVFLLIQADVLREVPWDKILYGGQGLAVLVIIAIVLLKWLPIHKDLKMREFDVRDRESASRVAQAESMTKIGNSLYEVAVEQRRAADSVKVLQRVNARNLGDYEQILESHEERLVQIEKTNVGTHTAAAQPAT